MAISETVVYVRWVLLCGFSGKFHTVSSSAKVLKIS